MMSPDWGSAWCSVPVAVANPEHFKQGWPGQIAPVQVAHAGFVLGQRPGVELDHALQQRLGLLRLQHPGRRHGRRGAHKSRPAVFPEPCHGLALAQSILAHDKINHAAPGLAAKTVEQVFGGRDVERGRLFLVERTEADVIPALFDKFDAPRLNHGHKVNALLEPG